MADFCKECSISNFGVDFEDLKGLVKKGQYAFAICEGCGYITVDHTGKCQGGEECLEGHEPGGKA